MTLRDVLFCLFQDLLRITVIDFVEALVQDILKRPRTWLIGFHFYCI